MASSAEITNTIYEETLRTIEGIKSATEHTITVASDEAKCFFDAKVSEATSQCEEVGKSMDNFSLAAQIKPLNMVQNILKTSTTNRESKKAVNAVVKDYSQTICRYEKETIRAINETWSNAKDSFNEALTAARSALGKQIKNLEKNMRDIIKYLEKIVADCMKLIKEFSRLAISRINDMSRLYLK